METIKNVASAEAKKTLTGVMYKKILENLENSSFKEIAKAIFIVFATILLTLLLSYPKEILNTFGAIFIRNNSILLKAIFSFLIVINFSRISEGIKNLDLWFGKNESTDHIEWIPTLELVDYLFENRSFKRDEVEKTFGIPRNRYEKLAKKLDELSILLRGENNARILNEEFTRQEVYKILDWKSSAEELKNIFSKVSDSVYLVAPAIKNIIKKREKNPEHVRTQKTQVDTDIKKSKEALTLDLSNMFWPVHPGFTSLPIWERKIKIENRQVA